MATKTVNYTDEQVATLTAGYEAGDTLEALAAAVGKTVASVRAKLAQLGLYTSKAKASKEAKGERVTKAQTAQEIATYWADGDARFAEDLTKLRAETLAVLVSKLS